MRNLIKKILREEDGFLDSTEEDWDWANKVPAISPYDTLKRGDFVKVVETNGLDSLLKGCGSWSTRIELNEEYFIEEIDEFERSNIICGCRAKHGEEYCEEIIIGMQLNGFWVDEEHVKVVLGGTFF